MTDRLYYTNSYLDRFDATVQEVASRDGKPAVRLDRSAFYPTSGGQPNDVGLLAGLPVCDVVADDGAVWHLLTGAAGGLAVGQQVSSSIDWPRRFDHMQQHSGQHLLSQVFERLFGYETVSVHIGADDSTLDLNTPELEQSQLDAAEELVNDRVYAGLPITAYFVDETQLAGLQLRRPPKVSGKIRIVEIQDYDFSACGGTHCHSTAELGPIKLTRVERRRGVSRVTFVCGWRAWRDYATKHRLLSTIAALYSTDMAQAPGLVERSIGANKELQRRNDELTTALLAFEADRLLSAAALSGGARAVVFHSAEWDANALKVLAAKLVQTPDAIVLLAGSAGGKLTLVFARGAASELHMGNLLRDTLRHFGGSGGGRPEFAQGGVADPALADAVLAFAREQIGGGAT